jgi:maleamate amidohydrolase
MAGPSASDNYAGVYEGRLQPGSRPALLIVDVVMAYLTEGSALFMETAAAARDSNARLAEAARCLPPSSQAPRWAPSRRS